MPYDGEYDIFMTHTDTLKYKLDFTTELLTSTLRFRHTFANS